MHATACWSPRLRLDFYFSDTGRIIADRSINTHSVLQAHPRKFCCAEESGIGLQSRSQKAGCAFQTVSRLLISLPALCSGMIELQPMLTPRSWSLRCVVPSFGVSTTLKQQTDVPWHCAAWRMRRVGHCTWLSRTSAWIHWLSKVVACDRCFLLKSNELHVHPCLTLRSPRRQKQQC